MKRETMDWKNMAARTALLVLGLFVLALGVALSTKSGLGVSPTAGVAYVLSQVLPLSMGTFTTLLNLLYLLLQLALLGKRFKPTRLLQLAVVFAFGYFTDFTLRLVAPLTVSSYPGRLLLSVTACAVMGFGIYLEVRSDVIVMASEGALSVVAEKTKKEFGAVKIVNDLAMIALTVVISFLTMGKLVGIREGTALSAVLVGMFTQQFNRHFHLFDRIFAPGEEAPVAPAEGALPYVITIEREWGSGGHELGERLAKELGMAFYDFQLIEKAAERTGLPSELVERREERLPGFLYTLYNQANAFTRTPGTMDSIFYAQQKIIRDLAARESCVILGRLGAYTLKGRENTFNVFLTASDDFRVDNLCRRSGQSRETVRELMRKEDEMRHTYCLHFTGKPWGLARHYQLCLDTSRFGLEGAYRLLRDMAVEAKKN